MSHKAQWFTPINQLKSKEEVWQKIEKGGWKIENLDLDPAITYFNNPIKYRTSVYYDNFFAYTKTSPLWDQRKLKDNSQYTPDVRENIYEQEYAKLVPALTSFQYGLSCRTHLDPAETSNRRINSIADFNRRRGVMRVTERMPQ